MFGTLRYDAQNDDTQFIERTTNPLSGEGDGQGPRYSACDKCRAKKVIASPAYPDISVVLTALPLQQRCGGQRDGCDRCKRTSSTCVYSLEGKGRGNRRRRRTEGHNSTSPGDSPPSSAPFVRRTTNTNGSEKAVKSRAPSPPKLVTPPPSTTTQNASLDDVMDFSPVGSFEDDFLMIQDILPDYDGQNIDNYLDTLTLPAQGDNDLDFYFGSGSSSDQISRPCPDAN